MDMLVVGKTYGEACSWVLRTYPTAAFQPESGRATTPDGSTFVVIEAAARGKVLAMKFDLLTLVGVTDEDGQFSMLLRSSR